ncbi:hypothetical protein OOK13_40225 [Streptomyces sp. NBC_00378]|uniref:hypothetical protein n=1 Tax=unclassified Streptomyces TaxID=2593676 RepID=UPI00224E2CDB|nr:MULTISPECIES: hypothetical protein [unclassified Streptomyces]MCX5114589.1 hypothetical protein [Streptomyces sp. NBC_00378]
MPAVIKVVRAEAFYLPPPTEPVDLWDDVPAAERVFRWMEYRMQRRVLLPDSDTGDTYYARVNQNRWIADCSCGSAQVVSPTDPRYGCTECGWGWCALIFPDDVAAVEAALLTQPKPYLRNWWHDADPANPSPPVVPDPPTDPPTEPTPEV